MDNIVNLESQASKANSDPQLTPLKKLQEHSDILLMLYPKDTEGNFSAGIKPEDEITIFELLKEHSSAKKKLLIVLDTGGGNVYSAVKIMDALRTRYEHITIAIPQEAKSSGTLMCCGANELIMCSISELGPLDKPMIHPSDETVRISALDIVKSIDGMLDIAEKRQKNFAQNLADDYGLLIKDTLRIASDSIAKLISPMLCREDVKIYNQSKRLLAIAEQYGEELLEKHMFSYIKEKKVRERVTALVVRRLVWLYPDHGFAVRRGELREWFFQVKDAENCDYWDEIWKEFKQNLGVAKEKTIKIL